MWALGARAFFSDELDGASSQAGEDVMGHGHRSSLQLCTFRRVQMGLDGFRRVGLQMFVPPQLLDVFLPLIIQAFLFSPAV